MFTKLNLIEEYNNKNEYFIITDDNVAFIFKILYNYIKDSNTFRVLLNSINNILHSIDIQELKELTKDKHKIINFINNNSSYKALLNDIDEIKSYDFIIYISLLVKLLVEKIISFNLFLSKKPINSKTSFCYIITNYTNVSITLEKFNILK